MLMLIILSIIACTVFCVRLTNTSLRRLPTTERLSPWITRHKM
jgi:hypothetical protein